MQLQSPHLADDLQCTPIIDWETPVIVEQTQAIIHGLTHDTAKTQARFEWVRDAMPHAWDMRTDIVTCMASEVLTQRTGLCYAKSHLLAAMLRCSSIPAGFCYHVFRRNPPSNGLALHGLNGLYLPSRAWWVRVDARGNTGTN
jgi:transglutaminase-like putative cysteine protease